MYLAMRWQNERIEPGMSKVEDLVTYLQQAGDVIGDEDAAAIPEWIRCCLARIQQNDD